MLGKRLKHLREEKGILQKDMARLMKISASAYGYYEQEKRKPDPDQLIFLSDFFSVSVDYLLGKTNIRNTYHDAENFLDQYIEAMKKSGFDLSGMTEEEIIEDVIKTMKAIKELNK